MPKLELDDGTILEGSFNEKYDALLEKKEKKLERELSKTYKTEYVSGHYRFRNGQQEWVRGHYRDRYR